MKKPALTLFIFCLLVSLLALPARLGAQGVTSSSITGLVTDASGKPVSGAAISAVDTSTGTTYTGVTRETGRFNIPNVKTGGPFRITASANGQTRTKSGVFTTLMETAEVNLQLSAAGPAAATTTTTTTTEAGATTERADRKRGTDQPRRDRSIPRQHRAFRRAREQFRRRFHQCHHAQRRQYLQGIDLWPRPQREFGRRRVADTHAGGRLPRIYLRRAP